MKMSSCIRQHLPKFSKSTFAAAATQIFQKKKYVKNKKLRERTNKVVKKIEKLCLRWVLKFETK